MAHDKTRLAIIIICLMLINVGCATWRKFSKPSIAETKGWELELYTGSQTSIDSVLKAGEIEVSVDPVNDGSTNGVTILPIPGIPMGTWAEAKKDPKVFEVRIIVRSYVPGYKFNPSKVKLKMSDGRQEMPIMYFFSPNLMLCIYGPPNNISENEKFLNIEDRSFAIPLYPAKIEVYDGCFSVLFSGNPPSTSDVFSVDVDGLSKNENSVVIPEIEFREGTRGSGW